MCVSCCSRILCLHLYLGETLQLVYRGAAWMSMSRGNARDVGRSQVELLCNNWKKLLRKMGCRVIHLARRHLWKSNPLVCWVGLGVDAGEGNGTPLQYSCLEKSHGRRSLEGCSPWGCWGLDTTERLRFHFSLSCIGEGNGNPLQCSCLENPRDGGAWCAAVYGVAQSRTWLKWLSSSSSRSWYTHTHTYTH